jgi:cephalosporin hydroxylase
MEIRIDEQSRKVEIVDENGSRRDCELYSREGFEAISKIWLKAGWALRYSYDFTWMGRPVIQLPEDLIRLQEVIWQTAPDVIVETGVAHGGSAVFYSSLLKARGKGRVISIDIEIRPHNRKAIEEHLLHECITLIERDSADPETLRQVRELLRPGETVLVALDSSHAKAHVLKELELYSPLVTLGSYIVAMDGVMRDLVDVPGGKPEWAEDNPFSAIHEFLAGHPEFEIDREPVRGGITYFPDAYLRRR